MRSMAESKWFNLCWMVWWKSVIGRGRGGGRRRRIIQRAIKRRTSKCIRCTCPSSRKEFIKPNSSKKWEQKMRKKKMNNLKDCTRHQWQESSLRVSWRNPFYHESNDRHWKQSRGIQKNKKKYVQLNIQFFRFKGKYKWLAIPIKIGRDFPS